MKEPLLSIIVPGYNVEDYIRETFDSVLAQTFTDYEVLMIDDGSPDGTGAIMDEYAAKYPQFIAIHTENGGLSAARNVGITKSRGRYIAFLDSDDVLTPIAYQVLVGSLESTGSDIAVGGVKRFNSTKEVYSYLHRKAIFDTVLKTTIREHQELIYDTTAWNKVYRKSLVVDNHLTFPVGKLYEDIPFVMAAHLLAKHVDIIDEIVYKWRWREEANRSITQQRNDLRGLDHRFQAIQTVLDLARANNAAELVKPLTIKAMALDLPLFVPAQADADDAYLRDFQKRMYRYLTALDYQQYLKYVEPVKQAQLLAVLNGDLKFVADFQNRNQRGSILKEKAGKVILSHEWLRTRDWASQLDLSHAAAIKSKLKDVVTTGDHQFTLKMAIHPQLGQYLHHRANLAVTFVNVKDGKRITLPFKQSRSRIVPNRLRLWTNTGVDIQLDFDALADQLTTGIWKIEAQADLLNLHFGGFVGNPMRGATKLPIFKLGEWVVTEHYNNNWEVSFLVRHARNQVTGVELTDEALTLNGHVSVPVSYVGVLAATTEEKLILPVTSTADGIVAKLRRPLNLGRYDLELYDRFLNAIPYSVSGIRKRPELVEGQPTFLRYSYDLLAVSIEVLNGKVTMADWQADDTNHLWRVTLDTHRVPAGARYILRFLTEDKASRETFEAVSASDASAQFEVPYTDGDRELFAPGRYNIFLDVITDQTLSYRIFSAGKFGKRADATVGRFALSHTASTKGYWKLEVTQQWAWIDRSPLRRGISYSLLYPFLRFLPIRKNVVLYDSFWSAAVNDNPGAMYTYLYQHHPELKHVWIVENTNVPFEGPATLVRPNSFKYWYYLAVAKYLVENTNMPNQYFKRKQQLEVQTFHGTFMKTMGFDEPHFKNASRRIQNNFARRIARWDLVITPSRYMSQKVRSAFNYQNEIIESGYPRNDALVAGNTPEHIAALREKLGIPADKRVVLYAPTFRTDDGFDFALDLAKLQAKLGDSTVFLVRLHYFVANNINIEQFAPFALDVSNYPVLDDLYLVSDALITDYSSVMFDYGYLKRPTIFFAYDYNNYVNDLRGIYLDYAATVPGPIVKTNDELLAELQDLPGVTEKYAKARAAFYTRFCQYGQAGDAAKQASERMLALTPTFPATEPLVREKLKILFRYNRWYPTMLRLAGRRPKRKLVMFEAFFGRNYSDNPKAIYNYLSKTHPEYKYVWNVDPERLDYFKAHHLPYVRRYSLKSARYLGRAQYWVQNTRRPLFEAKPAGTIFVQTWHGTPLKTIGRDVDIVTMPGKTVPAYHADVIADSSKWDFCLSPNPYSTEIFQRAFRLRPEQMVNSGYPRNAVLHDPDPAAVSALKAKLHIPAGKKVVLYAPTWRDNEYVKADYYTAKLHLDLAKLKAQFGDDMVLLIRTHYLIANSLHLENDDFAIDVSSYEDISELYEISDILITDYSSVFFDFANLKRPIIFYAYDLADYADDIRGFYFDYHKEAPGAIVETEADLTKELAAQLAQPHLSSNYDAFVAKFGPWDDGEAAKRAGEFILGDHRYQVATLETPVDTITAQGDFALWSAVIGLPEAKLVANFVGNRQSVAIAAKAQLRDPLQGNLVGEPSYQVMVGDQQGWLTATDLNELKHGTIIN